MGGQIPVIEEKPLAVCGCHKFKIELVLFTRVEKKTHDWSVDQLSNLFRTTHRVKTQQVVKSRGQHCGDIELTGYLTNTQSRWFWTSDSPTTVLPVALTLLLMGDYTIMI
jgi:hypothetical protein